MSPASNSSIPAVFTRPASGQISRRTLLAGAAVTVGVGGVLTGCSDPTKETNTQQRNVSATKPTYKPVNLVEPDQPGNETLMAGYYTYPQDPKRVFTEPPCAGLDEITIMQPTFVPKPPGRGKNAFFDQLEKNVGCKLTFRAIPSSDYGAAFQTTIAGGDLPDVSVFTRPMADEPKVMNKLFCDLGPYLAGDAAKDYPYLAAMPPYTWANTVSNGTIYAIPQPRPLAPAAIFIRLDIADELGVNPEPASLEEFQETLRAVTDPKKRRWAFANTGPMVSFLQMMLDAPNSWTEEGGKFTHALDDDRTYEAIQLTADMIKEGLFHPDTPTLPYAGIRDLFYAGRTALLGDGAVGWDLFVRSLGGPEKGAEKLGMINAPKAEGGGDAQQFAASGVQGISVIKKDLGEEKTRKVLALMNFLATPIGSREHLERKYGVEGQDFEWVDGLPTLTDTGSKEFMDVQYITDSMTTIGPAPKVGVDKQYAFHKRSSANPKLDPSVGLYSDTYSRDGAKLNDELSTVQDDVLYGRKKISELKEAYKKWRKDGGDKIAAEYAESLAALPE